MRSFDTPLPIDAALAPLTTALAGNNAAVLVAPPGAGKTTRVPLVLIDEPWAKDGKILLLQPRRLAARAAAARMAATLGERVGDTVGLRVRFESKVGTRTRIEVVTEGVFTRLILDNSSLDGVAAVLFDEFHERSLDADLGLALAKDVQLILREDLKLLVMSATLDVARVAGLLGDAPVVASEGRSFPVETRYLGRNSRTRIERPVTDAVERALRTEMGSLLVFLPGAAEIHRSETRLRERISDPAINIIALYGALDVSEQNRAIAPPPPSQRKVVLATSIAETSLTINGVRVVIDSGLARVPRYEPDVGLTRLETVRVSRAAADQRRGRAGRTEPGVCYRLWDEPQNGSLEPYTRPEILSVDLSSFLLDLAQWGVSDPSGLAFLDTPPRAALNEARALLRELGAIDNEGRITEEGRRLRALPLAPRLTRMVVDAAQEGAGLLAAEIAVLLTERGLGGDDVDLRHRLGHFRRDRSRRAEDARAMAGRWASVAGGNELSRAKRAPSPETSSFTSAFAGEVDGQRPSRGGAVDKMSPSVTLPQTGTENMPRVGRSAEPLSSGAILSLAYPDRIAKNRGGVAGVFLIANGRGGTVGPASAFAREPFLAVAELAGNAAASRILLAAPITLAEIEVRFADRIEDREAVTFDAGSACLRARRTRRLGTLVLSEQARPVACDAATPRMLAQGIVSLGLDRLPWSKAALQFFHRVQFLRNAEGNEWPDLSKQRLADDAAQWLEPLLFDRTALSDISAAELSNAIMTLVPWNLRRKLDAEAPTHFTTPSGRHVAIDYEAEQGPTVSIRVQELFGLATHPTIAGGRVRLVIELLSPAQRPVQVTRDLLGFWRGSYAQVKTEMRGRYPKHPWPDDPLAASATWRAKRRGQ